MCNNQYHCTTRVPPETSGSNQANKAIDESEEGFGLQEDYFTCPTPVTNPRTWLKAFYNHLNPPDAGERKTEIIFNMPPNQDHLGGP